MERWTIGSGTFKKDANKMKETTKSERRKIKVQKQGPKKTKS